MKHIAECPAERATYFLGGKWKIRILFNLFFKKKVRFGELRKILSKILKSEEKSDLKKTNSNVNSILYSLGIVENKLGACIPFGTSVVGIFQKKSK